MQLFGWTKGLKKYVENDTGLQDSLIEAHKSTTMTDEERQLASKITIDASNAEAVKQGSTDDSGNITATGTEDVWDDEYKLYKGGGLQWSTTLAYRTKASRKKRPNSEDNFIFNTMQVIHSNITANNPEITIEGVDNNLDPEIAAELTDLSRFNDKRNKFKDLFSRWVMDFIGSGPTICMTTWDNDWMGGSGPDRWIGDVRLIRVDKKEFFPDPAILDLENNMDDCSYVIRRPRKKISWIKETFKDKAACVHEDQNDDDMQDEGADPQQAYVYEYWHRGFPFYMPSERAKALREKAVQLEAEGDFYKAQDYYDSAKGDLKGIHVAYVANGILLDYVPYMFEHGKYPFVFRSRYIDDNNQWGYGEIRNIKIPQIMHNKADEIEIEAMAQQGLGNDWYQSGAINPKQMKRIIENRGKGGQYFEVDNLGLIKERQGTQVPASIINFKEHKQRMIETITPATPIQQGMSPGNAVPYSTVAELGNRSDIRMKQGVAKLESFIRDINILRLHLFAQFYTEDRTYRVKGTDGETRSGTFNNSKMMAEWDREQVVDEFGNVVGVRKERFVPEFDVSVTIMSEKPTDRNYYTTMAMQLYQQQLLTGEDVWYTLEEGKFPPKEDVLEHLQQQNIAMAVMQKIQGLPPEMQQGATQAFDEILMMMMQGMPQEQEKGGAV